MSEQSQNEQAPELSEENLEEVSGGIIDGCIGEPPIIDIGCVLFPTDL